MNLLNYKIIALLGLLSVTNLFAGEVVVQVDGDDPVERYAVARIQSVFAEHPVWPDMQVRFGLDANLPVEGYHLEVLSEGEDPTVKIAGGDARGLLYGSMNLLEQLGKVEAEERTSEFYERDGDADIQISQL